jgi:NDP-sugar pyrophosphorylase family protein
VLLLNGDSYCEVDVHGLQRFHETRAGGVSMVVARVEDAARFGRVQRGADGEVLRFEEKRPGATPGWINAGIYLLPRVLLTEIPPGRPTSLEREVLPAWVAEGLVQAFETCGRFIDIGTPESYAAAEGFFEVVEVAAA